MQLLNQLIQERLTSSTIVPTGTPNISTPVRFTGNGVIKFGKRVYILEL